MNPKAFLQTVQHELQQLIQDLLVIDEKAQSGKETDFYGSRDQGSDVYFASKGKKSKMRAPAHPSPLRDMACVYDTECGKRKRSDAKGLIARARARRAPPVAVINTKLHKLKNQQFSNLWRLDQSVFHEERGQCC